jgi:hypothetical protein
MHAIIALILLFLLPAFHPASGQTPSKMTVEIILDASGSMAGKTTGGEVKIDAAKKAVSELLSGLPGETGLAFRAYGHQSAREKHDCQDTQLLVSFGSLAENNSRILSLIQGLAPRGYTPITFVIGKAAGDFPTESSGTKMIILVSDGKETCEGDPCATAKMLAKSDPKLVIHTVGFGADEATGAQLDCVARATGGQYFRAENATQLVDVLNRALRTAANQVVEEKGDGWIRIKGADLSGHVVIDAANGKEVARAGHTQDTVKVPAGIYNVTVGQAVWKSIEVKSGKTTILEPGLLTIRHAALSGHDVVEGETGVVHGKISSLDSTIALIPGSYNVMFGRIAWPVEIRAGKTTALLPGTVQVKRAGYQGHAITDKTGAVAGEVSNIQNWIPLPPGDYVIEIGTRKIPFTLKEGDELVFENKD